LPNPFFLPFPCDQASPDQHATPSSHCQSGSLVHFESGPFRFWLFWVRTLKMMIPSSMLPQIFRPSGFAALGFSAASRRPSFTSRSLPFPLLPLLPRRQLPSHCCHLYCIFLLFADNFTCSGVPTNPNLIGVHWNPKLMFLSFSIMCKPMSQLKFFLILELSKLQAPISSSILFFLPIQECLHSSHPISIDSLFFDGFFGNFSHHHSSHCGFPPLCQFFLCWI
jgi:hypothetical protein